MYFQKIPFYLQLSCWKPLQNKNQKQTSGILYLKNNMYFCIRKSGLHFGCSYFGCKGRTHRYSSVSAKLQLHFTTEIKKGTE